MLRVGGASSNHGLRNTGSSAFADDDGSRLAVAVGALPAVLGNVEDDAVGVLELALEIAVTFVTQIEEEFAAGGLDALLGLGQIVDLEAEMVGADEAARIFQVRGLAAGAGREIKQREIDDAVAHIDG